MTISTKKYGPILFTITFPFKTPPALHDITFPAKRQCILIMSATDLFMLLSQWLICTLLGLFFRTVSPFSFFFCR